MLIPLARECEDVVASIGSSASAYMVLCLNQIATALTSGAYTCTLTTSGKTAQDVQAVRQLLFARGYRLTQSTTTITIRWDNSVVAQLNS
jgi:hypothetical protein